MSRTTSPSYTIPRARGVCVASGARLEPGARCVVALVDRPDDAELVRLEFSEEAWAGGARPETVLQVPSEWVVAHWRSSVPEANHKPRLLIDDGELLEIFEQLEGAQTRRRLALRFVLALWLLRRRVLVPDVQSVSACGSDGGVNGGREMLLRRRGGGEARTWRVVDPGIDEQGLSEVLEELQSVLAGETDAPAGEPGAESHGALRGSAGGHSGA